LLFKNRRRGTCVPSAGKLLLKQKNIYVNSWSISGNSCLSLLLASEQENRKEVAFFAKQKNASRGSILSWDMILYAKKGERRLEAKF